MTVLIQLLACGPAATSTTVTSAVNTSYPYDPLLLEATAQCTASDGLVVSARTVGWHERAMFDLWTPSVRWAFALDTKDITEDEYCDVMVGFLPARTPSIPPGVPFACDAVIAATTTTMLLRVNYEEGCAGCVFGPDAGAIPPVPLVEGTDISVLDGEPCDTDPYTGDCDLELAADLGYVEESVHIEIGAPPITACP